MWILLLALNIVVFGGLLLSGLDGHNLAFLFGAVSALCWIVYLIHRNSPVGPEHTPLPECVQPQLNCPRGQAAEQVHTRAAFYEALSDFKIFGAAIGFILFLAITLFGVMFNNVTFNIVNNAMDAYAPAPADGWKLTLTFSVAILIHHTRIFLGYAFAEHLEEVEPFTLPGRRTLRAVIGLFMVTYPLFAIFSKIEALGWIQGLWAAQLVGMAIVILLLVNKVGRPLMWAVIGDFLTLLLYFFFCWPELLKSGLSIPQYWVGSIVTFTVLLFLILLVELYEIYWTPMVRVLRGAKAYFGGIPPRRF